LRLLGKWVPVCEFRLHPCLNTFDQLFTHFPVLVIEGILLQYM